MSLESARVQNSARSSKSTLSDFPPSAVRVLPTEDDVRNTLGLEKRWGVSSQQEECQVPPGQGAVLPPYGVEKAPSPQLKQAAPKPGAQDKNNKGGGTAAVSKATQPNGSPQRQQQSLRKDGGSREKAATAQKTGGGQKGPDKAAPSAAAAAAPMLNGKRPAEEAPLGLNGKGASEKGAHGSNRQPDTSGPGGVPARPPGPVPQVNGAGTGAAGDSGVNTPSDDEATRPPAQFEVLSRTHVTRPPADTRPMPDRLDSNPQ
eukprot:GHVU01021113.1.p1 GENE.GHVU01021113.1~~GHVU01021113.1.p1  ORF type:complete len:260 (-),score=46.30 GHVU01021113.1:207-986(-)